MKPREVWILLLLTSAAGSVGGLSRVRPAYAEFTAFPAIVAVAPAICPGGETGRAFRVNGFNFNRNSIVRWNGINKSTQFIDDSTLLVSVQTAKPAGIVFVDVFNPEMGGINSNGFRLRLDGTKRDGPLN